MRRRKNIHFASVVWCLVAVASRGLVLSGPTTSGSRLRRRRPVSSVQLSFAAAPRVFSGSTTTGAATNALTPVVVGAPSWAAAARRELEATGVVALRVPGNEAFARLLRDNYAGRAVDAVRDKVGESWDADLIQHDVCARGRGRYDVKFDSDTASPWDRLAHYAASYAARVVPPGDDLRVSLTGCVVSFPGATPQHFHADGQQAFVNVFVPLVDVDARNGPTEFALTSHVDPHAVSRAPTLQYDDDAPKAAPLHLSAGDLLVFDYRVVHRGLGNTSDDPRPVFYAVLAPPGETDTINFPERNNED